MENRQFSKEWFAARLAEARKSQAGLFHFMEERFGLDRSQVNKMVNGRRRPQPNELPDLMEWLGLSLKSEPLAAAPPAAKPDVDLGKEMDFPDTGPRDVAVYQLVTGGDDGDFIFTDEPIDHVRRPHSLNGQRVIAAYVTGESMSPRYEPGDPVFAYVARPAMPGDYVIVEMHPKEEGGERRGFIKKLVRRSSNAVVCEQFKPPIEIEYPNAEVRKLYKIVSPSELLS